ncbi:nuclease [Bryobacterales bacterium F-183]|nr:nuclease [Bryobacterales bacterium F-183]
MNLGRLLALATALPLLSLAASPDLVISHIYGAGGNNGATYNQDFVVLFNRGTSAASLSGKSLQYASAAGNFGASAPQIVALPAISLQPGRYHLIAMTPVGANGIALPTADTTGTTAMNATVGKLAIVTETAALNCGSTTTACDSTALAKIIDLVGYGTTANLAETAPTPAPSPTNFVVRANGGCTDTDNNSTDFATAVAATTPIPNSATPAAPCSGGGGPVTPTLNISDVSAFETNSGTTDFTFTVSLTSPAGASGVSFTIATQNNTATAPSDYTATSASGVIPPGSSTYTFVVPVLGDTTVEPDETFFVNITNLTGASAGDLQGTGTIRNDDVPPVTLTSISAIQGSGPVSPLNGQSVNVEGIVTARISNGFFLQSAGTGDGNPATSDGIFVFTSSTPSANAAVGNLVRVSGTVTEFSPSTDLQSPPVTELINATVSAPISTGNTLPAPVTITPAMATPNGGINQLEHLEGMRVTIASLRVVAPTDGSVSDITAESTTNGVFYGVMPNVATPFREAGIQTPSTVPVCAAGSGCAIPVFDGNPERIRVDSDAAGQSPIEVGVNQVVSNLTGVLHYGFRAYSVLPTAAATVSGTPIQLTATPIPGAGTVSIAAMNVERLFDAVNDGGGTPVANATGYSNRLGKISKTIRDVLRTPDVVAFEEAEKFDVLRDLATRITTDAAAAGQPDPAYTAYLVEGNDVGGIDVGFLVRNTVQVDDVTQFGAATTYISPCNGNPETLNDRPPLRLRATANRPGGQILRFIVFVNHLRSLNDVDSTDPCGVTTAGARVRAKRAAQANYLADLIQAELTNNPTARIVAVGDFNAFEVNDGLVDVLNAIIGSPAPATRVVTATNDPTYADLTNMLNLLPVPQRYSYVFDGNHQTLDHVLLSPLARAAVVGGGYARVNSDFPESLRNNPNTPERYSDHDPVVVHLTTAPERTAKLEISRGGITYNRAALTATSSITIRNNTPDTLPGPFNLVLSGLTNGVTVLNATSHNGAAYVFSMPAPLAPGQSVTIPLQFSLTSIQTFNYVAAVFNGVL